MVKEYIISGVLEALWGHELKFSRAGGRLKLGQLDGKGIGGKVRAEDNRLSLVQRNENLSAHPFVQPAVGQATQIPAVLWWTFCFVSYSYGLQPELQSICSVDLPLQNWSFSSCSCEGNRKKRGGQAGPRGGGVSFLLFLLVSLRCELTWASSLCFYSLRWCVATNGYRSYFY